MKVVILCGGMGTRISEETDYRPKPMIEIGGKPLLWHIMKIYSFFGFNEFVLCLGYKGEMIKEYFLNYEIMNSDFTIDLSSKHKNIQIHDSHGGKVGTHMCGAVYDCLAPTENVVKPPLQREPGWREPDRRGSGPGPGR